jgi:hypothetical protein
MEEERGEKKGKRKERRKNIRLKIARRRKIFIIEIEKSKIKSKNVKISL